MIKTRSVEGLCFYFLIAHLPQLILIEISSFVLPAVHSKSWSPPSRQHCCLHNLWGNSGSWTIREQIQPHLSLLNQHHCSLSLILPHPKPTHCDFPTFLIYHPEAGHYTPVKDLHLARLHGQNCSISHLLHPFYLLINYITLWKDRSCTKSQSSSRIRHIQKNHPFLSYNMSLVSQVG